MKLQAIVQAYRPAYEARYGHRTTPDQWSALNAMLGCRTAQYGALSLCCEHCHYQALHPLSCGHRACAQCHQHSNALWAERQCRKVLPVTYFMLTFTLPSALHPLAREHSRVLYGLLFEAAIETLRTFGGNDSHLQGEPAATAVLHTHSRRLDFHPHLHLVVPGGVLDATNRQWRSVKGDYLFNHFNLAQVFRGIFLKKLAQTGLDLPSTPKKWVVDCKSVGQGVQALQYLSRYLYRGVLSESQLVADDGVNVTFRYKDGQTGKRRTRTVKGETLIRLLLLHVLPKGFRRARDFGFLHGNAKRRLALLQYLLKIAIAPLTPRPKVCFVCPCCQGVARVTGFIRPEALIRLQPG